MTTNVSMIITPTQSNFDLKCFWTLESIGISQSDVEVNMTENYLTSCVTRPTDGAYVAKFPWRTWHPPLPSNYTVAECRT